MSEYLGNEKITYTERVWQTQTRWLKKLDSTPGWNDFQKKKLIYTLAYDDNVAEDWDGVKEFVFDEKTEKEHLVITRYNELRSCLNSIKECEFYFRRYPFKGLPVTKADYLRNNCELFFNKISCFRDRIKNLGDAIQNLSPEKHLDIGKLIKDYNKRFKYELKERNLANHHQGFSDLLTSRITLISLLEDDIDFRLIGITLNSEYKRVCRDWILRIRKKGDLAEMYLEAISKAMLSCCQFLIDDEINIS